MLQTQYAMSFVLPP